MKTAVSYRRVSSGKQLKGHGLTRQKEMVTNWIKRLDLQLVDDLVDDGLSAFKGHHKSKGELGVLLHAVQSNSISFDCLLVENFDRLGRMGVMDQFSQFSILINAGIELHIISEDKIFTSESINKNPYELFGVLAQMARSYDESKQKAQRVKKAFDSKMKLVEEHGVIFTKTVPVWLKVNSERTKFTIKPEAELVQRIFQLALQGYGATKIAKVFTKEKIPVPVYDKRSNSIWTQNKIQRILSNHAVYGKFVGTKTTIERDGYYPAIVSKEDFFIVQQQSKVRLNHRTKTTTNEVPNLFSGLLTCGHCDRAMRTHKLKNAPFLRKRTFRCKTSAQTDGCCHNNSYHLKSFEIGMILVLFEIDFSTNKKNQSKLPFIKAQIDDFNKQNENLVQAIMSGNVSKLIINKSVELEQQIADLKKELIKEEAAENISAPQLNLAERDQIIEDALYNEVYDVRLKLQSKLQQLISNIKIYDFGVLIELSMNRKVFFKPLSNRDFTPMYTLRIPDDVFDGPNDWQQLVTKSKIKIDTSRIKRTANPVV
ncbi:putative phage resolvase/recombinase/integrase [Moritella viscosa]|nr:recombinase family protein [Moritella viscosa]CED59861.1 putative phage resolvase/recombinase/integrase [Moritella viscosa]SHO03594.1 Resolvase domain protein [Moritella viscosa]